MNSASQTPSEDVLSPTRRIAVISGKGGSGKTLIATVMAEILDQFGPVTLIDTDTGTAGLSFYLGLKMVANVAGGIADMVFKTGGGLPRLQELLGNFKRTEFLSVGDHRRLSSDLDPALVADAFQDAIRRLSDFQWIIADCRGGIDQESLAICEAVDDIILVVEPDTTSYQASQHVVDVLSNKSLASKLRGFIINKVFEDPSVVARSGTAVFRCQCLGAVPFDLDAMRDFLIGNVPSLRTQFATQVWSALSKAYPLPPPDRRVWSFEEFSQVSLSNIESIRGGLASACLLLLMGILSFAFQYAGTAHPDVTQLMLWFCIMFLGLVGSLEPTRRTFGRAVGIYLQLLSRGLGTRRR